MASCSSLYTNNNPQGLPKFVAYRTIPWSATDGLTICLGLFFHTLMAYAPATDETIGCHYEPLDRWVYLDSQSIYWNNTSGRTRTELKPGHVELVKWVELKDVNGRNYFHSYKGTTYLEQRWNDTHVRLYTHDHNAQAFYSWEEPKGSCFDLPCHVGY